MPRLERPSAVAVGLVEMLTDGLNFVVLAMGVFGLGEIIRNLEHEHTRSVMVKSVSGLWLSRDDFKRVIGPVLRGTGLGSVLGILPGGGAMLASFAAYTLEKRLSPNRAQFGKSAIEGVAAPEAANNAGAQIRCPGAGSTRPSTALCSPDTPNDGGDMAGTGRL